VANTPPLEASNLPLVSPEPVAVSNQGMQQQSQQAYLSVCMPDVQYDCRGENDFIYDSFNDSMDPHHAAIKHEFGMQLGIDLDSFLA